jgi:signal transduction histidine kinase/ActR/RegA family two-component response regulator
MTGAGAELRVLVLTPTRRDAELSSALLERAGIQCRCCASLDEIHGELDAGAGALLLPEEAIEGERNATLLQWLQRQPPWSDLPLLVLARAGADSPPVAQAMDLLGNVTVLERPTRVAALISALRSALRARARQYELRAQLVEREGHVQALRDAGRRKDEFLATLAHELRNPLAPIGNSVQALRLRPHADPDVERIAQVIERQVTQMVRLVDDLLEMSRVTRGRIELRMEHVDAAAVIRSAVETSQPLIDAARHQLTVTLPAEPLTLRGDAVRLAQVFANLLNNAAKYTDEGGRIWLTAYREGRAAVVTVRDSGLGIPAQMLPRVFDLFTQLPETARRSHGGLGIGLTLVKTLVEMHAGTVQARSPGPGQGSEFIVRLPLVASDLPAAAPPRAAPARPPLRPRRVMVVDDNRDAADSLGLLLSLLGLTIHVAHGGAAALQALATFNPSLVFLDIGMPEMDGHEVARRIRALPEWQHLTLVALTGWGQDEDRRRSRQAGFDHHLIKPVDVRALEALLRDLDDQAPPLSITG